MSFIYLCPELWAWWGLLILEKILCEPLIHSPGQPLVFVGLGRLGRWVTKSLPLSSLFISSCSISVMVSFFILFYFLLWKISNIYKNRDNSIMNPQVFITLLQQFLTVLYYTLKDIPQQSPSPGIDTSL